MLKIKTQHKIYEMEFDGIKVFFNAYPELTRELLNNETSFIIDNHEWKKQDIIYINNLTTWSELLVFSKNSKLMNDIIQLLDEYPLIDTNNQELICNVINNKYQKEILETNEGDVYKIVSLLFETKNTGFINKYDFLFILEHDFYITKKLFIIDNFLDLEVQDVINNLNKNNFIFITDNFLKIIKSIDELELITIINEQECFEFSDKDSLIDYWELKSSIVLTNNKIYEYKKDLWSLESLKFISEMKKIADFSKK
ncbi:hypothetical protein [Ureaplasma ceti]|uniref:Uncharacterized protein n=1 Tax=Ureaplasma ceti TaxID=3119530 RepID=A0ABP9U4V5_9BACT